MTRMKKITRLQLRVHGLHCIPSGTQGITCYRVLASLLGPRERNLAPDDKRYFSAIYVSALVINQWLRIVHLSDLILIAVMGKINFNLKMLCESWR